MSICPSVNILMILVLCLALRSDENSLTSTPPTSLINQYNLLKQVSILPIYKGTIDKINFPRQVKYLLKDKITDLCVASIVLVKHRIFLNFR